MHSAQSPSERGTRGSECLFPIGSQVARWSVFLVIGCVHCALQINSSHIGLSLNEAKEGAELTVAQNTQNCK